MVISKPISNANELQRSIANGMTAADIIYSPTIDTNMIQIWLEQFQLSANTFTLTTFEKEILEKLNELLQSVESTFEAEKTETHTLF